MRALLKDSKERVLDHYLLLIKRTILGINGALNVEGIPLKLTLELYEDSNDFNHLTNQDLARIKEAPKRINNSNLIPYNFSK
ncbi:TPA: hypothetical protein ACT5CK_002194 [Flavobacterium psychrophilum]|uniref:hypothetical protein n=1 Tax=Flavobacterium psychrophilum TaxID=96345 RepID=UPI00073EF38B|nr:hypothetical protein [Flavobacterium psychrophilum]SNB09240.1 hypothetical protein KU06062604_1520004 [Flavobacterium psychrophilum]GAQ50002.1 hypothetical protein FPK15_contig00083-0006 [Flavobacterium psychrophilum]GAW90622.1 hypothetical protein FPS14_contig00077-0005 [Flavobacterium psychrophilum]GEJ30325.1 hypothetical protein FPN185_contig00044-0006 [Flavobacterium psychrophilum]GEJ30775.1 hypothetical protein FPN181_contig00050-0007 [Flavobacterium psychrophilum]